MRFLLVVALAALANAMAPPRALYTGPGFRIVRCFPQLARREADAAVAAGRVTVNGAVAGVALRIKSGDVVTLDGRLADWESFAASLDADGASSTLEYWAYRKPLGVVCTTDAKDKRSLRFAPALARLFSAKKRVFPVGRLDADSEGLVLLTSDGACADACAQPRSKLEKTYVVALDRRCDDAALAALAAGVEITTTQQRTGATTTAVTRPCRVERRGDGLVIALTEGRHRQIRKMAEAVGRTVTRLERVGLGALALGDLAPGDARPLTETERAALVVRRPPPPPPRARPGRGGRRPRRRT